MSPMELYVRFMFTLALGLTGLSMVLLTLLDTLLRDWDAPRELRRAARALVQSRSHVQHVRAEDILLEIERGRRDVLRPVPLDSLDRRREALREIREAERRLASPLTPEVV